MSTATASASILKISPGGRPGTAEDGGLADGALQEGLDDCELRAWRGLLRTHASLAKRVESQLDSEHKLPLSSYEVLRLLLDAPGARMRMCDLAEQVQLSRSGLTRLVDRLEREQLLSRCTCDHDARGAYACLTERGRARLCEARKTHREVVREHFLSHFSEAELQTLASMWDRLAASCCGGE